MPLTLTGAGPGHPPAAGGGGGGGGSPTTLNPSTTPAPGTTSGIAVSGGNLVATGPASSYGHAASLGSVPAGSLTYFEVTLTTLPSAAKISVGLCNSSKAIGPGGNSWVGADANACGVYDDGGIFKTDVSNQNDTNLVCAQGNTIGVEVDETAHTVKFRKGAYLSGAFACPAGTLYAFIGLDASTAVATANFGATSFVHTPTAGYTGRVS